ncbi:coiled-coil domain-containing protein [Caballeronia grimmiae]|uniref:hypothetical protein n=1 Tax=Caballeronia grimmiae TaxID=1071679 RepID=UPI0038BCAD9C
MNDLIQDIAQIQVPHDLLSQINVDDVLTKFRNNFKRLDDLKRARNEHEQRGALMRWWHNDKLKDAQLDAQELQAEFSKSLAQLMVISMLQSKRLADQQEQIGTQQRDIKRQTERLEAHTAQLDQQQGKLHQQAVELEKLVNEYFALRGLTQEGARKLITIAAEVKKTRDELLDAVQSTVDTLRQEHGTLERFVKAVTAEVDESFAAKAAQLRRSVDDQCVELRAHLKTELADGSARLDRISATLADHMRHAQTQSAALAAGLEATDARHVQAERTTQTAIDSLAARQQAMNADIDANGARIGAQAEALARLEAELTQSKAQAREMQVQLEKAENNASQNASKLLKVGQRAQRLARIGALISVLALMGGAVSFATAARWIHF